MERGQSIMTRIKQTVTTKVRRKKYGGKTGLKKCPNCGGDGVVKIRKS